jgi:hypothetical protein
VRESQGASLPQRLQLTKSVNIRNSCVFLNTYGYGPSIRMDEFESHPLEH